MEELEKPHKIKLETNGLPDDIFRQWIEKIDNDFNNEMTRNDGKMISYSYIPTNEYERWVEYTRQEASGRV